MLALTSPVRARLAGILAVLIPLLSAELAFAQRVTPLVPYDQNTAGTGDIAARGLKESDFPRIKKLADNVYVFEALHQSIKTLLNNSLIVITSDGVLVADGHGLVETTQALVEAIRGLTPQPIKYVVIASDHGDHTGGNSAFPDTATFIAHPTSKATLERAASAPNRSPTAPKVVIPTELVSDKRTLRMGSTQIDILHLGRAHTGGDLVVYLPAEKVLWMSESFHHRIFPSVGGGYPSEWVEALKKAEQMDVRIYAPAHGFVDSPEVLKEGMVNFRRALESAIAEAKRMRLANVSAEDAAKQASRPTTYLGGYASWYRYAENMPTALQRAYLELDGKLPPSPAPPSDAR